MIVLTKLRLYSKTDEILTLQNKKAVEYMMTLLELHEICKELKGVTAKELNILKDFLKGAAIKAFLDDKLNAKLKEQVTNAEKGLTEINSKFC